MTLLTMRTEIPGGRRTAASPQQAHHVTDELTRLLFDGDQQEHLHATWRRLITHENFRYQAGLGSEERTALSYSRLHLVNNAIGSAWELADDPRLLASLHEWTGVVDGALGTLAGIHYNLFLGSLLDHDQDGRRDLTDFESMARTGTFLCTELEHGNDAAALQTTCELDLATGEFVLNTPTPGAQKFMPNTSRVGGPKSGLVAARLVAAGKDHGVFLFLTPLTDDSGALPGVRIRMLPERTGSPVDHCLTSFHQVRLPREALLEAGHGRLDEHGALSSDRGNPRKRFLHSISRVTPGKLCMSAAGIGVSRAALAIAVHRGHHRTISGTKPGEHVQLNAHRSHHGRLLNSIATTYAMTFLHRHVLNRWLNHTPQERPEVERLIAITKGWITWQSRSITLEARERCGSAGLFPQNGMAEFALNLEGAITAEGDNLVIWVKAGAEMVFGHQTPPAAPPERPVHEESISDLRFLHRLTGVLEGIWQNRARAALRKGLPGEPLKRWNRASVSAIELVSAHARRQAAEAFLKAIDTTADPATRSLLEQLCRLFLLEGLSGHTGNLLADGHLAPHHVHELPCTVDELTDHLAGHLLTLVNAFDLPEGYLSRIPLATGSYTVHLDALLDEHAEMQSA